MKLKIIIEGKDKIKNFVCAVQMVSKYDRLIFIVSNDKITIFVEKPIIWVDIDIQNVAESYLFEGVKDENDKVRDYIYFDINSNLLLFPMDALLSSDANIAEISITKYNDTNTPYLRVCSKEAYDDENQLFDTEIPIIMILCDEWERITIPRELSFDCSCRAPKYLIFRKYIEIYKNFKFLRFHIKPDAIGLESGTDLESRVMTTFDHIKVKTPNGEELEHRRFAVVDSGKLGPFFQSICILGMPSLSVKCFIKHLEYLKIQFFNNDRTMQFNSIWENIAIVQDECDIEEDIESAYQNHDEGMTLLDSE